MVEHLKRKNATPPEEDDLERTLEASISLTTTFCDSSRYGVMASYHQLEKLRGAILHAPRRFFDDELLDQIKMGLHLAENDHKKHVERGTCINEEPTIPKRRKKVANSKGGKGRSDDGVGSKKVRKGESDLRERSKKRTRRESGSSSRSGSGRDPKKGGRGR
jgi:hypothetical protein